MRRLHTTLLCFLVAACNTGGDEIFGISNAETESCEPDTPCEKSDFLTDNGTCREPPYGVGYACSECHTDAECPSGAGCLNFQTCVEQNYLFCDWRAPTPSGLETFLIGDWVVYRYDTDYGFHQFMRFHDDGTATITQMGECSSETECFASPGLTCSTTRDVTWSADDGIITIEGEPHVATVDASSEYDLEFREEAGGWYFRAASCPSICPGEL